MDNKKESKELFVNNEKTKQKEVVKSSTKKKIIETKVDSKITEKIVEDIFAYNKYVLAEILSLTNAYKLNLFARQMKFVDNSILDMLYTYEDELLLIELKAVPFEKQIIEQINGYYDNLIKLQNDNKILKGNIRKIILVTEATESQKEQCEKEGIELQPYILEDVLNKYHNDFEEISKFFVEKQPTILGASSLGGIKEQLNKVKNGQNSFENVPDRNHLSVAYNLGLVNAVNTDGRGINSVNTIYTLSEKGKEMMELDNNIDVDVFNEPQYEFISKFVQENPFYSKITFGILSVVDIIFVLLKAVPKEPEKKLKEGGFVKYNEFKEKFIELLGKKGKWTVKSVGLGHFIKYTEELGFIHKIGTGDDAKMGIGHLILLL